MICVIKKKKKRSSSCTYQEGRCILGNNYREREGHGVGEGAEAEGADRSWRRLERFHSKVGIAGWVDP